MRLRFAVPLLLAAAPCVLAAQQTPAPAQPLPRIPQPRPMPAYPRMPAPEGFRVFLTTDMEGIASVVFNREIIAGNEGERYRNTGSPDYWSNFRDLLTREVNAAIAGARRGGARSFVVNEGHGGNLFGNILPWSLDTAALLVRGWPKPLVMTTGLDSSTGAAIFLGFHAGPRTPGVIAHGYAFDSIVVNGRWMNETGVNALVAGEYGVPVVLVSGDDVAMAQAREQLGGSVMTVTTKLAVGSNAAVTWSPATVRQMLMDSATVAVRRAVRGEVRPFRLDKPYQVDLVLRRSFPSNMADAVDSLQGFPTFQKTGDRTYHFVTSDAREMARLFDMIELIVLR
jgi:D-amino peptidase